MMNRIKICHLFVIIEKKALLIKHKLFSLSNFAILIFSIQQIE